MARKLSLLKPNFAKNKPNSQKRTPHKQNVNLQQVSINGNKVLLSVREARTLKKKNIKKAA